MARVFLGLGSNLGDRVSYVQQAVQFLKDTKDVEVIATSSFYETEPVGIQSELWFVNAVVEIKTTLDPEELLKICFNIELKLGRIRDLSLGNPRYQSRTIDIDLLFYDNLIISTDFIQVPHPRVHERAYALVPMLEIDPDFIHPVIGTTISHIHTTLLEPEEVYLYGTRREEE